MRARERTSKRPRSRRAEKTRSKCWTWRRNSRDNKRKSCTTCFLFQSLFCRLLLYSSGDKMTLVCVHVELKAWKVHGWGVLLTSLTPCWCFWSLLELGPDVATPFPPCPVICMCGQAVEQRGSLCQANSGPFVGASHAIGGLWWLHGKKVLVKITSFTFSCELPVVCECTTDKLCGEGQLFLFYMSDFAALLHSGYFWWKKCLEINGNFVSLVCVYI